MYKAIVSPKGAVVIPAKLRKKYDIKPGSRVQILEIDGRLQLLILPKNIIKHSRGSLRRDNKTVLDLLSEGRAEDQQHEDFLEKAFGKIAGNSHES